MKDVWGYTLWQLYCFLALAIRYRKDLQSTEAIGVRVAYHGDAKAFDNFIDSD